MDTQAGGSPDQANLDRFANEGPPDAMALPDVPYDLDIDDFFNAIAPLSPGPSSSMSDLLGDELFSQTSSQHVSSSAPFPISSMPESSNATGQNRTSSVSPMKTDSFTLEPSTTQAQPSPANVQNPSSLDAQLHLLLAGSQVFPVNMLQAQAPASSPSPPFQFTTLPLEPKSEPDSHSEGDNTRMDPKLKLKLARKKSREKKKEMMSSLEQQVNALNKKVKSLTFDNERLKDREEIMQAIVQYLEEYIQLKAAAAHHLEQQQQFQSASLLQQAPNPMSSYPSSGMATGTAAANSPAMLAVGARVHPPLSAAAACLLSLDVKQLTPAMVIDAWKLYISTSSAWVLEAESKGGQLGRELLDQIMSLNAAFLTFIKKLAILNVDALEDAQSMNLRDARLPAGVTEAQHWCRVAASLDLTRRQRTHIQVARDLFFAASTKYEGERGELSNQLENVLQSLSMISLDKNFLATIEEDRLLSQIKKNIKQQSIVYLGFSFFVIERIFTSLQMAKLFVHSHPFFASPLTLMNIITGSPDTTTPLPFPQPQPNPAASQLIPSASPLPQLLQSQNSASGPQLVFPSYGQPNHAPPQLSSPPAFHTQGQPQTSLPHPPATSHAPGASLPSNLQALLASSLASRPPSNLPSSGPQSDTASRTVVTVNPAASPSAPPPPAPAPHTSLRTVASGTVLPSSPPHNPIPPTFNNPSNPNLLPPVPPPPAVSSDLIPLLKSLVQGGGSQLTSVLQALLQNPSMLQSIINTLEGAQLGQPLGQGQMAGPANPAERAGMDPAAPAQGFSPSPSGLQPLLGALMGGGANVQNPAVLKMLAGSLGSSSTPTPQGQGASNFNPLGAAQSAGFSTLLAPGNNFAGAAASAALTHPPLGGQAGLPDAAQGAMLAMQRLISSAAGSAVGGKAANPLGASFNYPQQQQPQQDGMPSTSASNAKNSNSQMAESSSMERIFE